MGIRTPDTLFIWNSNEYSYVTCKTVWKKTETFLDFWCSQTFWVWNSDHVLNTVPKASKSIKNVQFSDKFHSGTQEVAWILNIKNWAALGHLNIRLVQYSNPHCATSSVCILLNLSICLSVCLSVGFCILILAHLVYRPTMMVFKFELIIFPFQSEFNKFSSLLGFEPRTSPVASRLVKHWATTTCPENDALDHLTT